MVVLNRRKQPISDTETKVGQSPLESKTVHPVFCMSSQASPLKLTCTIAIQETEDTPIPSLRDRVELLRESITSNNNPNLTERYQNIFPQNPLLILSTCASDR